MPGSIESLLPRSCPCWITQEAASAPLAEQAQAACACVIPYRHLARVSDAVCSVIRTQAPRLGLAVDRCAACFGGEARDDGALERAQRFEASVDLRGRPAGGGHCEIDEGSVVTRFAWIPAGCVKPHPYATRSARRFRFSKPSGQSFH